MRCRYCGDQIFFFSCDCGSRVVFDELGAPWAEHRCLEGMVAAVGSEATAAGLARLMMAPVYGGGVRRVGAAVRSRARAPQTPGFQPRLQRLDPYEGARTEEVGIVREIIDEPRLARQLLEDSLGAAAVAKRLPRQPRQATIHTGAGELEDPWSVTFVYGGFNILTLGDVVRVVLRAVTILGTGVIWVADEVEHLT